MSHSVHSGTQLAANSLSRKRFFLSELRKCSILGAVDEDISVVAILAISPLDDDKLVGTKCWH